MIDNKKPYYIMGVDAKIAAYCLMRNVGGVKEIIPCKAGTISDDFEEEITNIAKYFNAKIYTEQGKFKQETHPYLNPNH